ASSALGMPGVATVVGIGVTVEQPARLTTTTPVEIHFESLRLIVHPSLVSPDHLPGRWREAE
ncbi:hypothetical protein, partial [Rhodoblastus acidophilus]|uniref:hypothetical protein n=1 Tax=Rhodoblastus acidophilus TaxID=1074 RepID=UPI000DBBD824